MTEITRIGTTYHPSTGELFMSFIDVVVWLQKQAEQHPIIGEVAELFMDFSKEIPLSVNEPTPEMRKVMKIAQIRAMRWVADEMPNPCNHDLMTRWLESVSNMIEEELNENYLMPLIGTWVKED